MSETMTTHTPGPWTRVPGERFRHDNSAGVRGPDVLYVAAALDFNRTDRDAEVEANARLIAASPNLLVAAQVALQALNDIPGTFLGKHIAAEVLRAAVAQATEEE